MSKSNISKEFKRDAVRQITERGYPVAEVSQLHISVLELQARRRFERMSLRLRNLKKRKWK